MKIKLFIQIGKGYSKLEVKYVKVKYEKLSWKSPDFVKRSCSFTFKWTFSTLELFFLRIMHFLLSPSLTKFPHSWKLIFEIGEGKKFNFNNFIFLKSKQSLGKRCEKSSICQILKLEKMVEFILKLGWIFWNVDWEPAIQKMGNNIDNYDNENDYRTIWHLGQSGTKSVKEDNLASLIGRANIYNAIQCHN